MSPVSGQCALVVPCYNEAHRLPVAEFRAFLASAPKGFELIFVDDGSSDTTLEVLRPFELAGARVLAKKPNAGKGEAVRYGMLHAVDLPGIAVVGFWDADLATPLDAVAQLMRVLETKPDIQMVFGARIKLLGREVERKLSRHYIGRVFATVVSNMLRLPVYDTQCGAKLFRVTPDLRRVLADPFLSRWIFDVEIIARYIRLHGVGWVQSAIYEYPLHKWQDVAGSKLKPTDFLKAFGDLAVIWNRYLRQV